jgi:streptogramin lyase
MLAAHRRSATVLAALTAVSAGVALVTATSAAAPRASYPVMRGGGAPQGIVTGADGNLWFVEHLGNRIGRMTPTGAVTEFALGAGLYGPSGISAGPDGNVWFTEAGRIGRISPAGVVTRFSAGLGSKSAPIGIAAGSDGNLWFTDRGANRVGRITPAGVITEFSAGITASISGPITAGPDGNLWFTESSGTGDRIGRITPAGEVAEFPVGKNGPTSITAGPDGNLWFTEMRDRIGRITPTGVVTEFRAGISAGSYPGGGAGGGIVAGPDGNLWFTELNDAGLAGNRIGRITPGGVVTEFSAGISRGSAPNAITVGPDGNLWFTEFDGSRIGRITPAGVVSEFPPTAVILAVRMRGQGRSVAVRLRCPAGAARQCRGILSVRLGPPAPADLAPQVRRLSIAPGRRAVIVFPLVAAGRRQLSVHGQVSVGVRLSPSVYGAAGVVQAGATLRARRPAHARR